LEDVAGENLRSAIFSDDDPTGTLTILAFRTIMAALIGAAIYACFGAYGHGLKFSQIVGIAPSCCPLPPRLP